MQNAEIRIELPPLRKQRDFCILTPSFLHQEAEELTAILVTILNKTRQGMKS